MASVANTFTSSPDTLTDASFRVWGSAIANAIANCGWVKTTDANQINWATVTTNATANVAQGYEVWHMNDTGANANQASNPVFMKVEYGTGAVANNPTLWVTVGTGCNTSGGLTGAISTRHLITSTRSANTQMSAYSGDVNRFHIAMQGFTVNSTMNAVAGQLNCSLWSIERTKDASGNDTNEGVLIVLKGGTSTLFNQQYLNLTAGPTPVELSWGALMPSSVIGLATGVQSAVYPIYHSKGVFLNPGMGVLCCYSQVVQELQTISVPIYGQNHTYMCFSNTMFQSCVARVGPAATCIMRWE